VNTPRINIKNLQLLPVPEGYKIRYCHSTDPKDIIPHPRTGLRAKRVTYAWLVDTKGRTSTTRMGVARCSPNDRDDKKFARIVAHNRCIKHFYRAENKTVVEDFSVTNTPLPRNLEIG
jgi:hypothetical protein